MDGVRYRQYPRIYKKKNSKEQEDECISFSVTAAAGIAALVFAKGVFWGYMLKKWLR
ncbi:hypothetical protein DFR58_11064 [Anaerobacterium chartisolvens]|uniref:Uncharacterized protein n=1 Tax=Anaerobacterium chartisolvens TaxID=1297424 RepID=A0A369B560_9FIRM|nr:hypothetical protein [Anaerobacterium chartisolvens]RCX16571.1 hypothetical protein DFR58_11064 [Anaerobacterium chartisolvens]